MTEGAEPPLPTPAENAEKRPCDIERAARVWEAKAKSILENIPRKTTRHHRLWCDKEVTYCFARAAGLREALSILAREEA
jgi:hypothetical protein